MTASYRTGQAQLSAVEKWVPKYVQSPDKRF